MARERRLVFGEVADLYDRYRPAYPAALVDDLVREAGLRGDRAVLEVGSGTGKATRLFAERGVPVIGVEPSAEMAAVAHRSLAAYAGVRIERADFEAWEARGRRFPLLFSAQAWHWVAREAGYAKARAVLDPGGLLAAFWNRPDWARSPLHEPMLEVYREALPGGGADGPMHPPSGQFYAEEAWVGEIEAAPGLGGPEVRRYDWCARYTAEEYAGLLATTSDVRLLGKSRREALLAAVARVIEDDGGVLELPLLTRLCLARRV